MIMMRFICLLFFNVLNAAGLSDAWFLSFLCHEHRVAGASPLPKNAHDA